MTNDIVDEKAFLERPRAYAKMVMINHYENVQAARSGHGAKLFDDVYISLHNRMSEMRRIALENNLDWAQIFDFSGDVYVSESDFVERPAYWLAKEYIDHKRKEEELRIHFENKLQDIHTWYARNMEDGREDHEGSITVLRLMALRNDLDFLKIKEEAQVLMEEWNEQ